MPSRQVVPIGSVGSMSFGVLADRFGVGWIVVVPQ